jgi:hypothetical protein
MLRLPVVEFRSRVRVYPGIVVDESDRRHFVDVGGTGRMCAYTAEMPRWLWLLPLLAGCGAKTGLLVPDATTTEAGIDAELDSGFDTALDSAPPLLDVGSDGSFVRNCAAHDFCFDEPLGAPPTPDRAVFGVATSIKAADVAFVVDTTGSMGSAIDSLKKHLTSGIFPGLKSAIPAVGLAVVDHHDYPVEPYGDPGDFPARVRTTITSDVATAQAAVFALSATGGRDSPEAQIPAMYHTLTGAALKWPGGEVPAHAPSPGTFGAVEFHPGSLPVVVEITDEEWHGAGHVPYSFPAPDMKELVAAFKASNARFVGLCKGGPSEVQPKVLSDATGSSIPPSAFRDSCGVGWCCTGFAGAGRPADGPGGTCRLNFLYDDVSGVSDGIVTAIAAISVGSVFDMTAAAFNDPANPGGVDATKFIRALRAVEEGDASKGCAPRVAKDTDGDGVKDTFVSAPVGTKVCFEVLPRPNDFVPETAEPQYFHATIVVLGLPGSVILETKCALFVVPAKTDAG